jgi:hypothetical protein
VCFDLTPKKKLDSLFFLIRKNGSIHFFFTSESTVVGLKELNFKAVATRVFYLKQFYSAYSDDESASELQEHELSNAIKWLFPNYVLTTELFNQTK